MVTTRHSLPTSDHEATLPSSSPHNRRLQNAIKKLQIDALPALQGERVEHEKPAGTYHWRGSVYAITANTRQDWLDQEPSRYKKRKSTGSEMDKGRGKQAVAAGKKRARTPDTAPEGKEERASKRPRRHTENYNVNYSRPRDLTEFTPGRRKAQGKKRSSTPEKAQDRMKRLDFTRVGGHEPLSCIEHARRRAAQMGYSIDPISRKQLARSTALEKTVASEVLDLARLNTHIEKVSGELKHSQQLWERYTSSSRPAPGPTDASRAPPLNRIADTLMAHTVSEAVPRSAPPKAQPMQPIPSIAPSNTTPTARRIDTQEPTPPSNVSHGSVERSGEAESDVEIITEPQPPTQRHDSGASLDPASSPDIYKPTLPTADLPATAKGGQSLRWSLPDRLNEVGRAEEAINRNRMTGESKSARRRRVKREMKLVRGWELQKLTGDDETAAGAEQPVERQEAPPAEQVEATAREEEEEEEEEEEDDDDHVEILLYTRSDQGAAFSPEGEESSAGSGERRSSRVEKHKRKVCRDWMRGTCHRGGRCTYKHGK